MVYNRICRQCGCSLVVKHQLPKLNLRVRFPLSAPRRSKLYIACSDFLYKKSEFAHAAAPRRGEPFDSPHFYQKYGFALSACRSFFPKSCAFGEFRCRFAAFAHLFSQKGTLGSSVRLQARSLTAHCRCHLFASMAAVQIFL